MTNYEYPHPPLPAPPAADPSPAAYPPPGASQPPSAAPAADPPPAAYPPPAHWQQRAADPPAPKRKLLTRRRFLETAITATAAAAGLAVVGADLRRSNTGPTLVQPSTHQEVVSTASVRANEGVLMAGAVSDRVLVLIDLQGGNDGLSTVVPYTSGTYYDLRPTMAIAPEEVLVIDDEVGLHPSLQRLHQRGLAIVEGVGSTSPSLSHFEMGQRWNRGSAVGPGLPSSGFLARLADTVDNQSPLVGLSVGGDTPRFANSVASTLAIDNPRTLSFLRADDLSPQLASYQDGLRSLGYGNDPFGSTVGASWAQLLDLGAVINRQTERERDESNPMFTDGGGLGRQLSLAADLISADVGVRVVHARLNGFDTHENHRNRHNQLMAQFDAAVDGFLQQVAADGMAERVLVASTSEFGRRVTENGDGLDHGVASTVMLAGAPVTPGRYGLAPPLTDLSNGNLRTQVPFQWYLASLAQRWLGVEGASVVPANPEIIELGV